MNRGAAIAGGVLAVLGLGGVAVYLGRREDAPSGGGSSAEPSSDRYALARAIASEEPKVPLVMEAIGFAIRNEARRLGRSILRTVAPNGWASQLGTGGYVSTARGPTAASYAAADLVLAPGAMDITAGCTNFDHPKTQNELFRQGRVRFDADGIAKRREGDGFELVTLPGVDPGYFRMWRRRGAGGVA